MCFLRTCFQDDLSWDAVIFLHEDKNRREHLNRARSNLGNTLRVSDRASYHFIDFQGRGTHPTFFKPRGRAISGLTDINSACDQIESDKVSIYIKSTYVNLLMANLRQIHT